MSQAKTPPSKSREFPKQLFVTREQDNHDDFLMAHEDGTDHIEDGQNVAVYALVETRTMRVSRELGPPVTVAA